MMSNTEEEDVNKEDQAEKWQLRTEDCTEIVCCAFQWVKCFNFADGVS